MVDCDTLSLAYKGTTSEDCDGGFNTLCLAFESLAHGFLAIVESLASKEPEFSLEGISVKIFSYLV